MMSFPVCVIFLNLCLFVKFFLLLFVCFWFSGVFSSELCLCVVETSLQKKNTALFVLDS